MARKPNPEPVPHSDTMNTGALAEGSQALNEAHQRSMEIAERFGDGSPYERSRVVNEARFYMGQSAEAMLELGKRLIQLKENEPHGEFVEILTERLGIQPRSAQRMMAAAAKYLSPALEAKATTLSYLRKAKLFELMDEADEEIAELADGGTLAGHSLDEIQAMSVRELRAALAEARKKLTVKERQLEDKGKKINQLDEALRLRKGEDLPVNEHEEAQLTELRTVSIQAAEHFLQMLGCVDAVMSQPATEAAEKAARHSMDYLVQRVVDACLERSITVDLAERVSPLWDAPVQAAASGGRRSKK